ncbi:MAG: FMN-binding protein [Treponema sp.]|jgi:electron transport complex protein RnfG|nr:FMN-binding protein [Treponema sp.]
MKMMDAFKLGSVLTVYAVAACVGLAFVYAGTEKIIEERAAADLKEAIAGLFPDSDQFDDISGGIKSVSPSVSFESAYAVKKDGAIVGVALQAVTGSYGGAIAVLTGVKAQGTISRIRVMRHSDTPGLGANAAKSAFYVDRSRGITFAGQFEGKKVSDSFTAKQDVAAISAATITSSAVALAVKTAGESALVWLKENGENGGTN